MIRVVVIDDSAFMRKALSIMLESDPEIKVIGTARDGEEGFQIVKKLKPDLVTMDVVMPKVNGIEALKGIKTFDPNAKVVMCTAVGQEQMVKLAIKTGAKGYIVKPFQAPKVLEEIKNVLGS